MVDGRDAVRELLAGGRPAWDRFAREYRLVVLKAVHTAARRFRAGEADVEDAAARSSSSSSRTRAAPSAPTVAKAP